LKKIRNLKTDKKALFVLLALLIAAIIYSYQFIPKSFYIGGGSCYQGITASIDRFFVKICGVMCLISIILILIKSKSLSAKILSILSVVIWSAWSIIVNQDTESEFVYFIPFLLINILIVFANFKNSRSANSQ
jgi:hypothetical protein